MFQGGFYFFALLLPVTFCLTDVRVNVPLAVIRGDDATLECLFDLEGDDLYSVKWYRGTTEFFRYTPDDYPPIKQFPTEYGLRVRESESGATKVVLENVPRSVNGRYMCEVTADQPSFFTVVQSGYLHVVDLPKEGPKINGLKSRYRIGENLKINCTSDRSNPAANLTWYINGAPADDSYIHKHRPKADGYFFNALSVLRLTIGKHLFEKGRFKVRCVSQVYDIYYSSNEKSIEIEKDRKRHKNHHNRTTILLSIDTSSTTSTLSPFIQWELSQIAAEKYPDTTLIFQSNINGAKIAFQTLSYLLYVLFLLPFFLLASIS